MNVGSSAMLSSISFATSPRRFFLQKIQVFRYESAGDALYTQNMNHNVLSQSITDVEILCYLSNANMTIFEHNFLHFFDVIVVNKGEWTTRTPQKISATFLMIP